MIEILQILVLTTLAGACIPLGGLIATIARFRPQWMEQEFRHSVIALGGGILLGAVALVLIPEGITFTGRTYWGPVWLAAGGVTFFCLERILGRNKQESPQ